MSKRMIVGLILFIVTAVASQTNAQSTPGIKKEQCEQQARIQQGVRSGELTRKEAARLEMQQAKINHHKRLAKADGVVTIQERAMIKHEQRRADRSIAIQKHDGEQR